MKLFKNFSALFLALAMLISCMPVMALATEDTVTPVYTNIRENENFSLHGVFYDETEAIFARMDLATAASIAGSTTFSKTSVYSHARESTGGRIRFSTDSSYIAIRATLYHWDATYATETAPGKFGFDVYVDSADGSEYAGMIYATPTATGEVLVEGHIDLGEAQTRSITVYFPITIETKSVEIGVESGAVIGQHQYPYSNEKPVVVYGASVEQGGCATKPSGTYIATSFRELNLDYTNLAVWGSCRGQAAFAEYIASLEMSVFVMYYDANERDADTLRSKHYNFYKIVRDAHPDIPIILTSRSSANLGADLIADMKAVIQDTYDQAVAAGDENIHFLDGECYFGYSSRYLADGTHPTDEGHARMSAIFAPFLQRVLDGEKNVVLEPEDMPAEEVIVSGCSKDIYSEDFEGGNSALNNWTTYNNANAGNPYFKLVTDSEGNTWYEFSLDRTAAGAPTGYTYYTDLLNGLGSFALEMDVALHLDDAWGYLGIIASDASVGNGIDLRLQAHSSGAKIQLYDKTDNSATNGDYGSYTVGDTDLAAMYAAGGPIYCGLRMEVIKTVEDETVTYTVKVSINGCEPYVYTFNPKNTEFDVKTLVLRMYSSSTLSTYQVGVDNLKIQQIEMDHVTQLTPAKAATCTQTGNTAYYTCVNCGRYFADADATTLIAKDSWVTEKLEIGQLLVDNTAREIAAGEQWQVTENDPDKWSGYTAVAQLNIASGATASMLIGSNEVTVGSTGTVTAGGQTYTFTPVAKEDGSIDVTLQTQLINDQLKISVNGTEAITWDVGTMGGAPAFKAADGTVTVNSLYVTAPSARAYYTAALADKIGLNVHMYFAQEAVQDGVYVKFGHAGTFGDPISLPTASADGTYAFTFDVAAKEMADEIVAQVYNSNGDLIARHATTVKDYAAYIIGTEGYSDQDKDIAQALLNYGAAAQEHFEHNTGDLANGGFAEGWDDSVDAQVLSSYSPTAPEGAVDGVTLYGSSLVMEGYTTIRHYFVIDSLDGLTVTADGKNVELIQKGSYYYADITGVDAANLDYTYELVLTRGEQTLTVRYSALSYVYQVLSTSTSETMVKLAKALYLYSAATDRAPQAGDNEFEILPF